MTEPIIIDGKWYEPAGMARGGMILLKLLPKQPEAEKKQKYIIEITYLDEYALYDELHLTPRQAQLAADAVKELLNWIADGPNNIAIWGNITDLADKARNAITKGKADE